MTSICSSDKIKNKQLEPLDSKVAKDHGQAYKTIGQQFLLTSLLGPSANLYGSNLNAFPQHRSHIGLGQNSLGFHDQYGAISIDNMSKPGSPHQQPNSARRQKRLNKQDYQNYQNPQNFCSCTTQSNN